MITFLLKIFICPDRQPFANPFQTKKALAGFQGFKYQSVIYSCLFPACIRTVVPPNQID